MTTLTNSFHNTEIRIKADVGDTVSYTTLRRVRKALCGIAGCTCGREDGTRDSRYRLQSQSLDRDAKILVVDTKETNEFMPTHVITLDNGERIEVQLVDGAAYTRAEWDANDQADYERRDNGDWTFQGQPFAGAVEAIRPREETK